MRSLKQETWRHNEMGYKLHKREDRNSTYSIRKEYILIERLLFRNIDIPIRRAI